MAVDLMTAALPAALGIAAGFGLAILIFKKTISKKYGEARKSSRHASISYWCGVIALIAIANGLAGISHELLFNLFNDSQIKSENIYKGAVGILIFPLIMLLFAFFLRTIFKDKASSTEISIKNETHYLAALQEIKENRQREGLWAIAIANNHGDNNKATAEYINTRVAEMSGKPNDDRVPEKSKNKNIYYALIAIFIAGGGGAYFYSSLKDGKELSFKTCTKCGTSGECVSTNDHKTLLISNDNVVTFVESDGIQRIIKRPFDENEKCTIIKEKGYAFECKSKNEFSISSYRFDGKNKVTASYEIFSHRYSKGSMTCDVE